MVKRVLARSWPRGVDVPRRLLGWEQFTGINLVEDNTRLAKDDAAFAMNVDFTLRTGAVSKALGTDAVLEGLGDGPINGVCVATVNGKQYLLAACGTTLWAAQGGQQVFMVDSTADWETGTGDAVIESGKISGVGTSWESPAYYIGSVAYDADLDYFSQGEVLCEYSVSQDGVVWSDWHGHTSGAAIEFVAQYIKVRFTLGSGGEVDRFILRTWGEFGNPQAVYTSLTGFKVRFAEYRDRVYFCDGVRPRVFNGETTRALGVDPPAEAPTLTEGAAGDLTGKYIGVVTFVNEDNVESNPSPASNEIDVTSKKIDWTIPTGPEGTAKRRLYRTKAGGGVYYLVTTIDDNTTTTYTDNKADGELTILLEDNNNVPPDATILWVYNDVMFFVSAADPTQLWYSKPGRPDHVPNITGNRFYKQFQAPITMVRAPVAGTMVVSGMGYTAVITGTVFHSDPDVDDTAIKYIGNVGALNHEAAAIAYNERYPVSVAMITETLQLYLVSPTLMREDVFSSRSLSAEVEPIFRSLGRREDVVMTYAGQKLLVALYWPDARYVDTERLANNVVLIYDMRLRKWQGVRTLAASALVTTPQAVYVGLVAGGMVTRLLWPDDEFIWGDRWGEFWSMLPYRDVGQPIKMLFDTGYETPEGIDRVRFRFLRLVVSGDSITDATKVRVIVDGREQVVEPGPIAQWNVPVPTGWGYGVGRQDAVISPRFPLNLPPGRFAGVRIEDESENPLVVYAIVLEHEPMVVI